MIAVDTSALMAIVQKEPAFRACTDALSVDTHVLLSAGTVSEALIVATGRGLGEEIIRLIDNARFEVVAVTLASSRRVAQAYARWEKGFPPARLSFGDCFAYEIAAHNCCPLLFIGNDLSQTDLVSVL